ncbi:unnamed protein product, partial [Urochloa humidicola]
PPVSVVAGRSSWRAGREGAALGGVRSGVPRGGWARAEAPERGAYPGRGRGVCLPASVAVTAGACLPGAGTVARRDGQDLAAQR